MSTAHRRKIEQLKASLPVVPDGSVALLVISPETWPVDAQEAYHAAGETGNQEAQFRIIEEQTGDRPSRTPPAMAVTFRTRTDGPQ